MLKHPRRRVSSCLILPVEGLKDDRVVKEPIECLNILAVQGILPMLPVRNEVREKRRQKLKNRAYHWPASLDQIISVEREHQLIAPENTRFGPLPRVVVRNKPT